jgi:hypothetical protein
VGCGITDLKSKESGARSQESGERGQKSDVAGQRSEDKYFCFSNFEIRNSQLPPSAPCSPPNTLFSTPEILHWTTVNYIKIILYIGHLANLIYQHLIHRRKLVSNIVRTAMTEGCSVDQLSSKQSRHSLASVIWSSIRRVTRVSEERRSPGILTASSYLKTQQSPPP